MPPKRLVSGGNDKIVKLWEFRTGEVNPFEQSIGQHDDSIRDVSWYSGTGSQFDLIASCSEDKTCKIWKLDF
jgi:WD40 repeat protein